MKIRSGSTGGGQGSSADSTEDAIESVEQQNRFETEVRWIR